MSQVENEYTVSQLMGGNLKAEQEQELEKKNWLWAFSPKDALRSAGSVQHEMNPKHYRMKVERSLSLSLLCFLFYCDWDICQQLHLLWSSSINLIFCLPSTTQFVLIWTSFRFLSFFLKRNWRAFPFLANQSKLIKVTSSLSLSLCVCLWKSE